jgi:L-rhamnose mutarotase
MSKNRYCVVVELKSGCVEAYREIHKNPWNEMLEAIASADVSELLIWNYKNLSIIYYECEDINEVYERLGKLDVVKKWNETVVPWFQEAPSLDGSGKIDTCEKIFDLKQQLKGTLEKY